MSHRNLNPDQFSEWNPYASDDDNLRDYIRGYKGTTDHLPKVHPRLADEEGVYTAHSPTDGVSISDRVWKGSWPAMAIPPTSGSN